MPMEIQNQECKRNEPTLKELLWLLEHSETSLHDLQGLTTPELLIEWCVTNE